MFLDIHLHRQADLPLVAGALRLPCFFPRFREDGEKDRCQYRYDSNDDQQLNEGKTRLTIIVPPKKVYFTACVYTQV